MDEEATRIPGKAKLRGEEADLLDTESSAPSVGWGLSPHHDADVPTLTRILEPQQSASVPAAGFLGFDRLPAAVRVGALDEGREAARAGSEEQDPQGRLRGLQLEVETDAVRLRRARLDPVPAWAEREDAYRAAGVEPVGAPGGQEPSHPSRRPVEQPRPDKERDPGRRQRADRHHDRRATPPPAHDGLSGAICTSRPGCRFPSRVHASRTQGKATP